MGNLKATQELEKGSKDLENAEAAKASLNKRIGAIEQQKQQQEMEINQLEAKRIQGAEEIKSLNNKLNDKDKEIQRKDNEIENLRLKLNDKEKENRKLKEGLAKIAQNDFS